MHGLPPAPWRSRSCSPNSRFGGAFWGEITVHVSMRSPDSPSRRPIQFRNAGGAQLHPSWLQLFWSRIFIRSASIPLQPSNSRQVIFRPRQRGQMDFLFQCNFASKRFSFKVNNLNRQNVPLNADICAPMSKETPHSPQEEQAPPSHFCQPNRHAEALTARRGARLCQGSGQCSRRCPKFNCETGRSDRRAVSFQEIPAGTFISLLGFRNSKTRSITRFYFL